MKYALGASAAVLALAFGGQALAACPDDIGKLRSDLQKNESFSQRYTAGKIDRASYMRLFDAARTFSNMGLDKRCQEVLAGIREVSEKVEAEAPKQPPAARTDTDRTPPPAGTDRDRRTTDAAPPARTTDRDTTRTERLRAAQPVNAAKVSFENLVGADVRNMSNEDLGDVEDFVMERGQVSYVVVARGGFLGMGVNYHMVPAKQVKVANLDDTGRDKKSRVLVLDLSADQVKAIPRVTKENGEWVAASDDRRTTPNRSAAPPDRAPAAPPSKPAERGAETPPRNQ
jgi:hypothetical protein